MKELDLYKFLKENNCDVEWVDEEIFTAWIPLSSVEDLVKLLGGEYLQDYGIVVDLREYGICLDLLEVCKHFEIDTERLLKKPSWWIK